MDTYDEAWKKVHESTDKLDEPCHLCGIVYDHIPGDRQCIANIVHRIGNLFHHMHREKYKLATDLIENLINHVRNETKNKL